MTCSHCHQPAMVHRLMRWLEYGRAKWLLLWKCDNPACVHEYREFDGPLKRKGSPVFGLPVNP